MECVGEFSIADVRVAFAEIREKCSPVAPLKIHVIDRRSDFNPTHDEVRQIADALGVNFEGLDVRVALSVGKELHYGLGRMVAAYAEEHRVPFAVFRTRAEAERWLGAD